MLDAMAGEHPRRPAVPAKAADVVSGRGASGWRPRRVAYSPDLGITPVDPEVAAITRTAAERLADSGIEVEEAHPDLTEAHECFQTLRALQFAVSFAERMRQHHRPDEARGGLERRERPRA